MDNFLTQDNSEILLAYETYLEETFLAIGANASTAAAYAKDITNLEVDIAKVRLFNFSRQKNVSTEMFKFVRCCTILFNNMFK